ncbi:hypothetical protein [Anaerotignum sp. MB30-C6]|uniref:hypothetical protein n=1 Tax=Anaerotignum sp. MB30-C6 TaxID=3070814 RepID=UPI0027DD03A7|nr:hypothetical protein [Anaerotignum sp. MB30-C6]WMI81952.1 hypothetical protein RBQ60_04260 [Anaerotignum sp. MB30-C6]
MIYIFENGRILYDKSFLRPEDEGKYLELAVTPEIEPKEGKAGVITGCDLSTGEVMVEYFDLPTPEQIPPEPIPPEPAPVPLSAIEQTILQTAINTEYIMSLMEVKG